MVITIRPLSIDALHLSVSEVDNQSTPSHVDWPLKRLRSGSLRRDRIGARPEVGQDKPRNRSRRSSVPGIPGAAEVLRLAGRNPVDVRGFCQEQVSAGCEVSNVATWPAVTGVGQRGATGRHAQPGIREMVRKWAALNGERTQREPIPGGELVQRVGLGQHCRAIQCEDGIERARECVDGQLWSGHLIQGPRSEQRVQVGTVVRVPVGDHHSVHRIGAKDAKQTRQRGIADVHQQVEAFVLHQKATAGLTSFGPGPAAAQNRESHRTTLRP
jgi:hypothetical protein